MIHAFVSYVLFCDLCEKTTTAEKSTAGKVLEAAMDGFVIVLDDFYVCFTCLAEWGSMAKVTFEAKRRRANTNRETHKVLVTAHVIHGGGAGPNPDLPER